MNEPTPTTTENEDSHPVVTSAGISMMPPQTEPTPASDPEADGPEAGDADFYQPIYF
ncbi:MAG: hypothetical protein R3202_03560 [Candidatus Competibacterales bacterium]|nr:hypothetical protein [Candidatus Competibacterales bacterium]